jgi:hypothetical protein
MKDGAGNHGQRDLKFVGEHSDQRHHDQGEQQYRGPGYVAKPLTKLTLGPNCRMARIEFGQIHGDQGSNDGDKTHGIEREAPTLAEGRDEYARDAGTDGSGHVIHGGIQADGVAQVIRSDHLENEGLARGVFKGVVESQHDGQHAHVEVGDYVRE